MNTLRTLVFCATAATIGFTGSLANAMPMELISNGGFESGDFTSWTVTDSGSGTFEVTSAAAPSNGIFATPGASEGAFYAVSSQGGPGTHALTQSFLVPLSASSVFFSFDMFVQTQVEEIVNSAGLDENSGPNQHARVDLLTASATPFDTSASSVLANFYLGIDGAPTQPYTSYGFDLTTLVTPGSSYQIRFAQSDNQGNFNQGVDNVSVTADGAAAVPAPATLALLGLGLLSLRLRRKA